MLVYGGPFASLPNFACEEKGYSLQSTMTEHPRFFFYPLCVCLLLLFSSPLRCHSLHGREEPETHYVVKVKSLLPKTVCSSSQALNTTGLEIYHHHGPCTPSNHKAQRPSHTQFFLQDEARANFLRQRRRGFQLNHWTGGNDATVLPARPGKSFGTGNYVVTIGLGTPKTDQNIAFDTGSDLTWVQCQPCVRQCYSQQDSIFDPIQSSTYTNVSCSSPNCTAIQSATGNPTSCSGSTCLYGALYGDNSYSVGFFAEETLTLSSRIKIPNFLFGCGQKNNGLFGQTAGLLGLGRNKLSFVSQLAPNYGGLKTFSYCLPSKSSSIGYLNFGPNPTSTIDVQFTPMLTDKNLPSFYFLDLIGIKVGGRQLPISPSVFQIPGTLIDSGTVITRLPPSAYSALRSSFRAQMSRYPKAPALSILDTCYDLSGYDTVAVPKVELVFMGGASLKVNVSGIVYVGSLSQVCLAFAGNNDAGDVGIIGNTQQKTIMVVYSEDLKGIGFGTGGCS